MDFWQSPRKLLLVFSISVCADFYWTPFTLQLFFLRCAKPGLDVNAKFSCNEDEGAVSASMVEISVQMLQERGAMARGIDQSVALRS